MYENCALALAKEIHVDDAVAAVLSKLDSFFA